MANSNPPPQLPNLVPHEVTKGEINIAHATQSSPVLANDAPVANLFCDSRGVSTNKRLSLPREKLGHTPARKKRGRTMRCASSIKARGVIHELLAALHVDSLTNRGTESSNLHLPFATPHGDDGDDSNGGHNKGNTSNDKDYDLSSVFLPPPSRLPTQNKKEPKIVLDCTFMTFLCPSTFDNQPFWKGQPPKYTNKEIDAFDNNFRKQMHFNFLATRMLQKLLESATATWASRLCDMDLDVLPKDDTSILPTKWHELSHYILEDILDCPVGSWFIVCIDTDGGDLEGGEYYSNKANTIAKDCKYWKMYGRRYFVWQGLLDHSSHYLDIKMKTILRHQFVDAFTNEGGDFVFQSDNTSTHLTVAWHDIVHASQMIMVFGYPFGQLRSFTSLFWKMKLQHPHQIFRQFASEY
jgi:hypothetical protein